MSVTNPFLICNNINGLHLKKKPAQSYRMFSCCVQFDSVDEIKIFNFYASLQASPQPANILVKFSIVVIFFSIFTDCLQTLWCTWIISTVLFVASHICELVPWSFLVSYTHTRVGSAKVIVHVYGLLDIEYSANAVQ